MHKPSQGNTTNNVFTYQKAFKLSQAHARPQTNNNNPSNCFKCGDTRHRLGFNYHASKYHCEIGMKHGYFISMCYNHNTKKVQTSLHLVNAQEICQLQLFSQYLCAMQNFINDCSYVDNVNNDIVSSGPFYIVTYSRTMQLQAYVTRPYADLLVFPHTHRRPLYLRCNVMQMM